MRYLGDLVIPGLPALPIPGQPAPAPAPGGGKLDPQTKAQLLALAPSIPDDQAQDLLDFVDETKVGHNAKLMRIGLGALGGLVGGVVLGMVLKK